MSWATCSHLMGLVWWMGFLVGALAGMAVAWIWAGRLYRRIDALNERVKQGGGD